MYIYIYIPIYIGTKCFACLFYIAKISHYGARRYLSFTSIKFDIILMGLKIPT